jgi:ATP-binding cassette, subfamily B, bacterial
MPQPTLLNEKLLPLFRQFFPYLRPGLRAALAVLLLSLLSPLLGTAFLWLFSKLVDEVFIGQQLQWLPWFAAAYLAVALTKFAVDVASQRLDASVHERFTQRVRVALYRHLISASPGSLGTTSTGDLLGRLSSDADRISTLVFRGPVSFLANVFRALCYGIFLFVLSWKLACLALLVVPPLVFAVLRLSARMRASAKLGRRQTSLWMSLAEERLAAGELVHAFHTHGAEVARFNAHCDRARHTELQTVGLEVRLSLAIEVITFLGGLGVIALAAHEVHAGLMTVGSVFAFLGAIGSLYDPVRSLSQSAGRFQRAAVSAERIATLLRTPSQISDTQWPAPLPEFDRGRIDFQNVSFSYADGTRVLDKVSLSIAPGESVALVGASGSGKSTLLRLLLRLYDPQEGTIAINDIDIRSIGLADLRASMGAVLQDAHILSGTVADNIRYGAPDATEADLLAAAQTACVDSFVQPMPLQYESTLAAHGEGLSGGQRQRLSLARALLRDAPILLMDEATAALDGETEELIRRAIDALAGQRTVVVVSHRLATISSVDRILVLSQGRIVESGSPAELLRRGTRCHRLFASQLADKVVPFRSEATWRAAN